MGVSAAEGRDGGGPLHDGTVPRHGDPSWHADVADSRGRGCNLGRAARYPPQPPCGGFVANSARNRRSPAHRARRRRPLRPVDIRQPGASEWDGSGGGDRARTLWGASGGVLAGHGEASTVHPDGPRDVLRCVSCDKVDGGVGVKAGNGYDVQGEFYGVLEPVA